MNSSFVEQIEEQATYVYLYGFLWRFGIQYKVGVSSFSSLIEIFIDDINYNNFCK